MRKTPISYGVKWVRLTGVIETLNRTGGEMPTIIAGVLKRIRDDIDKFVDNKTKDYENI